MNEILRKNRSLLSAISLLVVSVACAEDTPDAYGTFETRETVVSSETAGRLLAVSFEEGLPVAAGAVLAVVDTSSMLLQLRELDARRSGISARTQEALAQSRVILVQEEISEREYERLLRLFTASAATTQQLDKAARDLKTLEAQGEVLAATRTTISRELASLDAQSAQIEDRIRRSTVVAPLTGTVLARYVEAGEYVQPGSPIARIASLDTLIFRAYVAGNQLSLVRPGAGVTVQVDAPDGSLRALTGRITWVSASAEFTPTPIQTREERVTQVYAVKVAVPNTDGSLRLGMPGELVLGGGAR